MIGEPDHYERVAQAFSSKARVYDDFGRDHPNLERMRRQVYGHVLRFTPPGARILEINAGTGADAVFFARQGFSVHATDLSPGMVATIQGKIERYGLEDRLSVQQCSFISLLEIEGRPFDAIFSNFGGLNCIGDLAPVVGQLPELLAPGGRLTWVIMPPVCPWDLALAFRGDFRTAFRRLHPGGTLAHVEGVRFRVRYYTPGEVLRSLGTGYQLLGLESLSLCAPPADRKGFARRHPRIYRWLARLDGLLAGLPVLRGWGDFFILTVERRP